MKSFTLNKCIKVVESVETYLQGITARKFLRQAAKMKHLDTKILADIRLDLRRKMSNFKLSDYTK